MRGRTGTYNGADTCVRLGVQFTIQAGKLAELSEETGFTQAALIRFANGNKTVLDKTEVVTVREALQDINGDAGIGQVRIANDFELQPAA